MSHIARLRNYILSISTYFFNLGSECKLKCKGAMSWRYFVEPSDRAMCDIALMRTYFKFHSLSYSWVYAALMELWSP